MVPRPIAPGSAAERRFFLAKAPVHGRAELEQDEAVHALRVLRVRIGDRLLGGDGAGREWPFRVVRTERDTVALEVVGEPRSEPEPGSPSAALPWIEVATALPRGERADELVDRLAQLGAARFVPLVTDRASAEARSGNENRRARLVRIAREACKQSGRLWPLEIAVPMSSRTWLERKDFAGHVRLDPRATERLSTWARAFAVGPQGWSATRTTPLAIVVGPEGGFSDAERGLFASHEIAAARLGPHVLRVECAAEAALAVIVETLFVWPTSKPELGVSRGLGST